MIRHLPIGLVRSASYSRAQGKPNSFQASGELLFGSDSVLSALQSGRRSRFHRLLLLDHQKLNDDASTKAIRVREQLVKLAEQRHIPIDLLPRSQINSLSKQRPNNGIILDADPIRPETITSLPDPSTFSRPPIWVALDQVVDPQNLGAILRSCSYFDVDGIILCGRNSAPLSAAVAKASCGALEYVNIKLCHSMPRFLDGCRAHWNIVGMAVGPNAIPFNDALERHKQSPIVLVVGNEGTGLRPLVADKCHVLAMLPKSSTAPTIVDSLNVSTALGIALYQISAQ